MDNFIENRIKQLNIKENNQVSIAVIVIFFIGFGGYVFKHGYDEFFRDLVVLAIIGMIFGIGCFGLAIGIIFSSIKVAKKNKLVENNPYQFLKVFGLVKDMKLAVKEFNDDVKNQRLTYYDSQLFFTNHYVLIQKENILCLGELSSVYEVCAQKTITTQKQSKYTTWDYVLYFDANRNENNAIRIACLPNKSKQVEEIITNLGFKIR